MWILVLFFCLFFCLLFFLCVFGGCVWFLVLGFVCVFVFVCFCVYRVVQSCRLCALVLGLFLRICSMCLFGVFLVFETKGMLRCFFYLLQHQ